MKSFKTHFGVVFSLVGLLFSIQFCILIKNMIADYELLVQNEYKIIVVSKNKLTNDDINRTISGFDSIQEVDTKELLDNIKVKMSQNTFKLLGEKMPKFYSIKLNFFPNSAELKEITKNLNDNKSISKVEVFAKSHNSVYKVLVSLKLIIYVFAFIVVVLGVMLILKQMKIWLFEHKERIEIMTLFGAPFLQKSAKLYRMALVDSFISTIIVVIIFYLMPEFSVVQNSLNVIEMRLERISILYDGVVLLAISLILSIVAVSLVMVKARFENR